MRMKCACVQPTTTSYERLPNVLCTDDGVREESVIQNRELIFYNDDGSYQTVIVEKDLCASDLCQLLALKNRVAKNLNWAIVEHWTDTGLERCLEDHEKVLQVYRYMEHNERQQRNRFVFRKDFRKYEFFHNPKQFFPTDMVDFPYFEDISEECSEIVLQNMLSNDGECPRVFSNIWVMDNEKRSWSKAFLLLKDGTLYLSLKVHVVAKLLRHWKNNENGFLINERIPEETAVEWGNLHVFGMITKYNIYSTLNAKNHQRAPTEFGICLRTPDKQIDADSDAGVLCLACESERARSCWITAMRLAKYGKQLKENYRAFKNKQMDNLNSCEYNSLTVPNESIRSRVAMDFTGSVGRIVEDPREVKAIAAAEGYSWKRRWRATQRLNAGANGATTPTAQQQNQGLESGVHITQPWFHSGMTRDQATQLVNRHGTVDGVFLVRESRSNPGSFVLTFRCGGKVIHNQIQPLIDPVRDALCYTLDSGVTKFYDLLQLIEFYQLNAGCLPTRLTHYLVQSPTGPLYSDKPSVNSGSPTTGV